MYLMLLGLQKMDMMLLTDLEKITIFLGKENI